MFFGPWVVLSKQILLVHLSSSSPAAGSCRCQEVCFRGSGGALIRHGFPLYGHVFSESMVIEWDKHG